MHKVKEVLIGTSFIVLFLLWFGWYARSDYTWSEFIIEQKMQEGWVVGATQANSIDITHPWTIFKQPIVRIAFVKPSEFIRLNRGMVFTKVLWVDYADMSRTEQDVFQDVYDCRNNRTAFVEDSVSAHNINLTTLEWQNNANTSAEDIAKVVCR